jgi:transcriptional regulator with XRE-family HTH domain
MVGKRKYKSLTSKQTTKVRSLTKKGKTQAQIAKLLGVSKQRVSNAQAKAGVGKRRPSPFWQAVKRVKEDTGCSHKRATNLVSQNRKWGEKRAARAGKKWRTPEERQAEMKRLREEFQDEKLEKMINQELEDVMYGDTPK